MTSDHIPPKSLFGKPRPSNLITVPCCYECHTKTFLDDEYLRTIMALDESNKEHEDIIKILPSVMRDLKRPTKWKFNRSIINTTFPVNLYSPSGISLGSRYAFKPEGDRLAKLIKRFVRGLFYYEEKRRLSLKADIRMDYVNPNDNENIFNKGDFQETVWNPLLNTEKHVIGNNTFFYWYLITQDNRDASVWLMQFYNNKAFMAITVPL